MSWGLVENWAGLDFFKFQLTLCLCLPTVQCSKMIFSQNSFKSGEIFQLLFRGAYISPSCYSDLPSPPMNTSSFEHLWSVNLLLYKEPVQVLLPRHSSTTSHHREEPTRQVPLGMLPAYPAPITFDPPVRTYNNLPPSKVGRNRATKIQQNPKSISEPWHNLNFHRQSI